MEENDRKIYNNVNFNYHINNYNLTKSCEYTGITLKEYYDICKRLNMPRTTQKTLIKIDDTMHFINKV